ncbi:unnamed protein product [Larinioides sclopetarius]|uniref:Uncharacterized protein n=1 Tax=Larinioides sclopetarius TaxID=280406 RepID=A0AAV2BCF8_9ARAC
MLSDPQWQASGRASEEGERDNSPLDSLAWTAVGRQLRHRRRGRGSENEKGFEGVEKIPPTVMREFRENMENWCDRSTRLRKPRKLGSYGMPCLSGNKQKKENGDKSSKKIKPCSENRFLGAANLAYRCPITPSEIRLSKVTSPFTLRQWKENNH